MCVCVFWTKQSEFPILISTPVVRRPFQFIENCFENGFGYTDTNLTVEG